MKVLVVDSGLAFGFVKNISSVGYCCVSGVPYPEYDYLIGTGFDEVEVIRTPTGLGKALDEAKSVVVVDNECKIPYREWYIMGNEMIGLEFNRKKLVDVLKRYRISVADGVNVRGVEELLKELERREWQGVIKVDSIFRGIIETKVVKSLDEVVKYVEDVVRGFGEYGYNSMNFRVDEYIEGGREYTMDLLVEEGRVKRPYLIGVENGKGYVCKQSSGIFGDFVEIVEDLCKKYKYNSALSIEMLNDGKRTVVTDFNVRWGLPFSLVYPIVMENWEDLLVGWRDGVKPVFRGNYIGGRIIFDNIDEWRSYGEDKKNYSWTRVMKNKRGEVVTVPLKRWKYNVVGVVGGYGESVEEVINMCSEGSERGWERGLENFV